MRCGLYTSATGLKTHGEGMNIISNNIANVNTVGYKQQLLLFSDLMYQQAVTGSSYEVVTDSVGMGASLGQIRTLHTEGPFELGNANTDLAISGKGFFQVMDDKGGEFYTRAGNFRFDSQGVLRDPLQNAVMGVRLENGREVGAPGEISINFNDDSTALNPPKATTSLNALLNVNVPDDKVSDPDNPYFSLLSTWNGTQDPPLSGGAGYSQPLKIYDADGNAREATIHFDAAPSGSGQKVVEYIVTIPPSEDGRAGVADTPGAGLVMAGTLTFSSSGELANMSAFTPGDGDLKDLTNWTPAALSEDGTPILSLNFAGQPAQQINFGLGISSTTAGWQEGAPANAAEVGTSLASLPRMSNPAYGTTATSAWPTTSALSNYQQDGHAVGELTDVEVDETGTIMAHYSNGQSEELYRIPIFRFTSEDGLRREGNNLYAATTESGEMSYGVAGTENYGGVLGGHLEQSNVDMASEMTSMIMIQRGFQSNSKSITTIDSMLQKAMELKR